MAEYQTIQLPIEQAETGMTVLFPDDESLFRIKGKKLAFSGQQRSVTLTEDSDVPRMIIDEPGFLLRRVTGTFDE